MTQKSIRIAIAEDEPSVRETLADLVSDESSFELVGTANDTQQAVELVRTMRPDVLLCDVKMTGRSPQVDAVLGDGEALPDD